MTVTRIASGLPVGGDLEYADEVTLGRALEGAGARSTDHSGGARRSTPGTASEPGRRSSERAGARAAYPGSGVPAGAGRSDGLDEDGVALAAAAAEGGCAEPATAARSSWSR